jgi:hypothetical protein
VPPWIALIVEKFALGPLPSRLASTLLLLQTTHCKRPNFRDPLEIAIDMNHAQIVVESRLGDEEVGDRGPMPHSVVMREVVLKAKRPVQ